MQLLNSLLLDEIKQVVLVEYIDKCNANLSLFEYENNNWNKQLNVPAYVGINGVTVEKREGDGKTPLGLFKLNRAFGIKDNPGTEFKYQKLSGNEYWIDDINSNNYNKLVYDNIIKESSEHLIKEQPMYNYSIVIEYNTDNIIKNLGSAIFLHVSNNKGTAGCVSVEENYMIDILKWVKPNKKPYIYII